MSPDDRTEDGRVGVARSTDAPEAGFTGSYGPVRGDPAGGLVYEEFSCEDALLATVRESDQSDRWIQSTVAVPIER